MNSRKYQLPLKTPLYRVVFCVVHVHLFFVAEISCANNKCLDCKALDLSVLEKQAIDLRVPLSLAEAEKECLCNNYELKASKLSEDAARAAYLQTSGALLPQITYAGNCMGNRARTIIPAGGFNVSQALLNSPVWVQRAIKRADCLTASLERIALENQLMYSVRTAYYTCVLTGVKQRVNREQVDVLQRALQRERQRKDTGDSTQFEVDQTHVALFNALSSYYSSCQSAKIAVDQLSSLLAWDPLRAQTLQVREQAIPIESSAYLRERLAELELHPHRVLGSFEDVHALDADRVDVEQPWQFAPHQVAICQELALQYQPELRIERLGVVRSFLQIKQQRANYLPNSSATYASNQSQPHYAPWQGKQQWMGAINFSWTLFNGFAREQGMRGAKLKWRANRLKFVKQRNDVTLQIRDQFHRIEEGLLGYFVANTGVRLAEKALDQAQVRQQLGKITPLDFRMVANQLVKAQFARVEAAFGAVTAYDKLRAMCASEYRGLLDDLGDAQLPHE